MFSPPKRSRFNLVQQEAPKIHRIAAVTGGLNKIYRQIKYNETPHPGLESQFGYYTREHVFAPQPGMPLMASRYRFLRILGRGQSSVFIKVEDVCQGGAIRAVKVLHVNYRSLGVQESDCIRRLNLSDPYCAAPIMRLCNVFSFHGHYCMVFEILAPDSLTYYFKELLPNMLVPSIRKVALRLLQAIGFLQNQNIIHADLKPTNILLGKEYDFSTLKVVDFGNSIRCVNEEISLYFCDFELQTLLYRAPEVVYGLPFGLEVDMWSLGCILGELLINRPLFTGRNKNEVLEDMTDLLGPLPEDIFRRGKFHSEYQRFTSLQAEEDAATTPELMAKLECRDYALIDFLRLLLKYNPHERMTVTDAARHPFLAQEVPILPPKPGETSSLEGLVDHVNYTRRPYIDEAVRQHGLGSVELLASGTGSEHRTSRTPNTGRLEEPVLIEENSSRNCRFPRPPIVVLENKAAAKPQPQPRTHSGKSQSSDESSKGKSLRQNTPRSATDHYVGQKVIKQETVDDAPARGTVTKSSTSRRRQGEVSERRRAETPDLNMNITFKVKEEPSSDNETGPVNEPPSVSRAPELDPRAAQRAKQPAYKATGQPLTIDSTDRLNGERQRTPRQDALNRQQVDQSQQLKRRIKPKARKVRDQNFNTITDEDNSTDDEASHRTHTSPESGSDSETERIKMEDDDSVSSSINDSNRLSSVNLTDRGSSVNLTDRGSSVNLTDRGSSVNITETRFSIRVTDRRSTTTDSQTDRQSSLSVRDRSASSVERVGSTLYLERSPSDEETGSGSSSSEEPGTHGRFLTLHKQRPRAADRSQPPGDRYQQSPALVTEHRKAKSSKCKTERNPKPRERPSTKLDRTVTIRSRVSGTTQSSPQDSHGHSQEAVLAAGTQDSAVSTTSPNIAQISTTKRRRQAPQQSAKKRKLTAPNPSSSRSHAIYEDTEKRRRQPLKTTKQNRALSKPPGPPVVSEESDSDTTELSYSSASESCAEAEGQVRMTPREILNKKSPKRTPRKTPKKGHTPSKVTPRTPASGTRRATPRKRDGSPVLVDVSSV